MALMRLARSIRILNPPLTTLTLEQHIDILGGQNLQGLGETLGLQRGTGVFQPAAHRWIVGRLEGVGDTSSPRPRPARPPQSRTPAWARCSSAPSGLPRRPARGADFFASQETTR